MKARSLVFDLFGDYLRYRGGRVRLRALVAVGECFGIPAATTRVAAARLRQEGWLTADRQGRETVYALAPNAWQVLDEGRDRIFARAREPWDGHWHMVIYQVPETERALRERLRRRLAWLGFGPLSPSVWLSPHDHREQVSAEFGACAAVQLDLFRSRSAGAAADRGIAARAWDLAALDRDYRGLLARYAPRLPAYRDGALGDQAALVERTQLVYDYRHFPFRDPGLPAELLPGDWPGRRAHDVFLQAHGLLRVPAERAVDAIVGGPAPGGSVPSVTEHLLDVRLSFVVRWGRRKEAGRCGSRSRAAGRAACSSPP